MLHFLMLSSISVYSQLYTTTRYADDSGLPSRIVNDVIQDYRGFIWVAGNNGLYKFDGQKFKPYLASLKDTIGLRDNKITALLETSDHKIWVGTPRGLHVLDATGLNYVKLLNTPSDEQEHVLDLFEDTSKNLWVSTHGGLFLIEENAINIIRLSELNQKRLPKKGVWGITQDKKGRIWVAAKNGLYLKDSDSIFLFAKLPIISKNEENDFFAFKHFSDSLILIESSIGLLKGTIADDKTITISRFTDNAGNPMADFFVEKSIIDSEGSIWVATAKTQFKKYQIKGDRLVEQEVIARNGFLKMSGNVKSVYQDIQGNIWMANTNGLYKLSKNPEKIETFPPRYIDNCLNDFYGIYAMVEDKGGHLWITTPTQLYRFNKSDILEGKCPEDFLLFEDERMQLSRNLFIDSKYRLWIGADDGLFVTQLDQNHDPGDFIRYDTSDGLPHNWSLDILEEDPNNFWVANHFGLARLSFQKSNMRQLKIKVYTSNSDRSEGLVNSQALDMEKDQEGNLWVGTFSGVSKLVDTTGSGTFRSYTSSYGNIDHLSNNSIKKIFKDNGERLWVATQRGLNLYLPDKDKFVQFGNDDGLPSEYILGIQEDSRGYLWVCTTNGVIKAQYDVENQNFINVQHFTSQSGLVDNIPYRNSILIDGDDNVFIGSREGISIFTTTNSSDAKFDFNLAITGIESTQKKRAGFKSISTNIQDDQIVLSHSENSIKITYAALDYINPTYNQYRHKFLPVNENWIETGSSSELSYYNLSPGEYELILDGSNSQGVWSQKPIHLVLIIKPPFWKSNWALFLYAFLGAALLRIFFVMRLRKKVRGLEAQAKLERALLNERERLRQENAADFHDELGSKVAKISLYLTMAERSLVDKEDPLPWFARMRDHIKGLSGDFRDLLWVIDPKKDSLGDAFLRLKDFGEELFNTSEITFKAIGFDIPQAELQVSPQTKKQLIMIFKEAMTNCLKYADCNNVELTLKVNETSFGVSLNDDGQGFNLARKSKGRGLKNMETRAKKISARLTITSGDDGTSVSLEGIPHMSDDFQPQDA